MKTVTPELLAHLAQEFQTVAMCIKVTRSDAVVLALTTHDQDIVFDGVTYLARVGGTPTTIADNAALSVNNGELRGPLGADSLTADDVAAGLWDFAAVQVFTVNWSDLTQGSYRQLDGWLGEVTIERSEYRAELRSLTQALTRTLGRTCTPLCTANLGDARCGVDLFALTTTGEVEWVSPDNTTIADSTLTEAGPGGGYTITGITNANPGVVTVTETITVANGSAVTIAGVLGMTPVNGVTVVSAKTAHTFELGIDTTDTDVYPSYSGGGTVTPAGGDSGYYDYGLVTFRSGLNDGLSMEVKTYVEGQFTLQLPMPYAIEVGDTYDIVAGCNKQISTCGTKFSNSLAFRGRPYVPGQDKLVQVGRHG